MSISENNDHVIKGFNHTLFIIFSPNLHNLILQCPDQCITFSSQFTYAYCSSTCWERWPISLPRCRTTSPATVLASPSASPSSISSCLRHALLCAGIDHSTKHSGAEFVIYLFFFNPRPVLAFECFPWLRCVRPSIHYWKINCIIGKHYQKIIIPILRLVLQKFALLGCFPYTVYSRYITVVYIAELDISRSHVGPHFLAHLFCEFCRRGDFSRNRGNSLHPIRGRKFFAKSAHRESLCSRSKESIFHEINSSMSSLPVNAGWNTCCAFGSHARRSIDTSSIVSQGRV